MTREQQRLIDSLNGEHTGVIKEIGEHYAVRLQMLYRDVFHTLNDEYPELELKEYETPIEELGEFMLKVADIHVINKEG